jgi:hypothetical protein
MAVVGVVIVGWLVLVRWCWMGGWLVCVCLFVFGSLVIVAFISHDGWS